MVSTSLNSWRGRVFYDIWKDDKIQFCVCKWSFIGTWPCARFDICLYLSAGERDWVMMVMTGVDLMHSPVSILQCKLPTPTSWKPSRHTDWTFLSNTVRHMQAGTVQTSELSRVHLWGSFLALFYYFFFLRLVKTQFFFILKRKKIQKNQDKNR